jgi:hypothetical protein
MMTRDPLPYFEFIILARTAKGNQLSGSKFGLPRVSITEGTHLRLGIWLDCLVLLMKANVVTGGRPFQWNLSTSGLFE